MSPAPPRSPIEELLENDPDVYATVLDWALFKAGAKDAEDITQTTIVRAVRRARIGTGWKGGDQRSGLLHLRAVMQAVLKDRRRRLTRKPPATGEEPEVVDDAPLPEELVAEKLELNRRRALVRQALEDDSQGTLPLAMLDAAAKGLETHAEVAKDIGCTLPQLHNARRRLERLAQRLLGETTS